MVITNFLFQRVYYKQILQNISTFNMKPIINPNIYNSFLSKVAQQNFLSPNKPLPKPCELVFMPEGFIKQEKVGSYDDFIAKFNKHYPKVSLKCFAYMMKFFSP